MSALGPNQHVAVVDLSFGDAGKGAVVDWLASSGKFDMVIKSSGGCQCAHHVLHPETGKVHRFAQFGSGTFRGLPTYLSRFFMVDPLRLASEAESLKAHGVEDPYGMIMVDERCLVTTPYHAEANRREEIARGNDRHGSCGVGIGKTMEFAIRMDAPHSKYKALRVADFGDQDILRKKLKIIYHFAVPNGVDADDYELPTVEELVGVYSTFYANMHIVGSEQEKGYTQFHRCIFEGSQGVLLDEWFGFHPHTTWSTTTFDNVDPLNHGDYADDPARTVFKLGVVRAYTTRHGAGPFPTETPMRQDKHEYHNGKGKFQGAWRIGEFDAVLHRYAIDVCGGVDGLAITHLDRPAEKICNSYVVDNMTVTKLHPKPRRNITNLAYQENFTAVLGRAKPIYERMDPLYASAEIEKALGAPCVIRSYGMEATERHGVAPGWYAHELFSDLARSA